MLIPSMYSIDAFQLAFEKNFCILFGIVFERFSNIWPETATRYFKVMDQSQFKAESYSLGQTSAV